MMSEIKRVKLTDLKPDLSNANQGTERGLKALDDSLSQLGLGRSIVVDKNLNVIGGNKTLERAIDRGFEDALLISTQGDKLVVVVREDLDLMDNDPNNRARKLAYADNRIGEIDLSWNVEQLLADVNAGFDFDKLFNQDELSELLAGLIEEPVSDPGAQIDRAAELQTIWHVERGDVWEVGTHRLMCGDSTNTEDVATLIGEEKIRLVWSDPPYGVDYADVEDSRLRAGKSNDRASSVIAGDKLSEDELYKLVTDALSNAHRHIVPGASIYITCPTGKLFLGFGRAVIDSGFDYRAMLVWVKNHFVMGWQDYHYQHEPIIYGWDKGGTHFFIDDRTQKSVFFIDKPLDSDEHPNMKPSELVRKCILNSSLLNEFVLDPFLGSGTTLVACEQTGRIGRGMEIAPEYVAVSLQRLTDMGLEPYKLHPVREP